MIHNILSSQAWAGIAVLVAVVGAAIRLAGLNKKDTLILILTSVLGVLGTFCFGALQANLAYLFTKGFPDQGTIIQLVINTTQTDFAILVGLSGSVIVFCLFRLGNHTRVDNFISVLLGITYITAIAALCHFFPYIPVLPDLTMTSPNFFTNLGVTRDIFIPLWASDIISGSFSALCAGIIILSDK